MILVDDEVKTRRISFVTDSGVDDPDAYFVIREELPYEGYMAYLDAAVSFELKGDTVETESAKMRLSDIQEILIKYGLVEIHGVVEKKTQRELTVAEWRRLPMGLLSQIFKEIQLIAKSQAASNPNSDTPSDESSN